MGCFCSISAQQRLPRRRVPRMAAADDAPQLSAPVSDRAPQSDELLLSAVQDYIQQYHVKGISWHMTLNNHASTRPNAHGGKLVDSLTASKTFAELQYRATWRCRLVLPNSFAPGDGRVVNATGEGGTRNEASENACREAIAQILLADPPQVLLRPKHWTIPPQALLEGIVERLGLSTQHQALPVHVPARLGEVGAEAASLSEDEVSERVTDIIKQCLNAHGGSFDPSQIRHKNLGLSRKDERMYSRLNKLLQPGKLRDFVDGHPEFEWHHKGPKGMVVTWADAAASAASAPGSASAAAPATGSASAVPPDDYFGHDTGPCSTSAPGSASAAEPKKEAMD